MKLDKSYRLYRRYFSRPGQVIEVVLKDHSCLQGVFVAFYTSGEIWDHPFITKWHLVDEKDKWTFGEDSFGLPVGHILNQKDIDVIRFPVDGSVMKF